MRIKVTEINNQDHSLRAVVLTGFSELECGEFQVDRIEEGSAQQNKLAHSLISAYFNSGAFSDDVTTQADLKEMLKYRIGEKFDKYVYIDPENFEEGIREVKEYKDIPEHLRKNPDIKHFARGRLKSWTEYTMKQRKKFIDNLIAEMEAVGVNTPDYKKIMKGLEEKARIKDEEKKHQSS